MKVNHIEGAAFQNARQMAALAARGPCNFELSFVDRNQPATADSNDRAKVSIGILKVTRARPNARRNDAHVVPKPTQRGRQIKNVTLDAAGAADVVRT